MPIPASLENRPRFTPMTTALPAKPPKNRLGIEGLADDHGKDARNLGQMHKDRHRAQQQANGHPGTMTEVINPIGARPKITQAEAAASTKTPPA